MRKTIKRIFSSASGACITAAETFQGGALPLANDLTNRCVDSVSRSQSDFGVDPMRATARPGGRGDCFPPHGGDL